MVTDLSLVFIILLGKEKEKLGARAPPLNLFLNLLRSSVFGFGNLKGVLSALTGSQS